MSTPRHFLTDKSIPFMFTVKIPFPLKSGVDYEFLLGSNVTKKTVKPKLV